MLKSLLLVGIGGAAGSMLRYLTSVTVKHYFSGHFPAATFVANILGCLLIGIFTGLAIKYQWANQNFMLLFVTGFCGGYTTFSTFALENINLMQNNNSGIALAYTALSIVTGIVCVWVGILLTK